MTKLQVLKDNIKVLLKLEFGTDINIEDDYDLLYYLCFYNRKELIKDLIQKGFDINIKDYNNENTVLIWASWKNNIKIVTLLLEFGADPNIQDIRGHTALIVATKRRSYEIVKLLLENNTYHNIKNRAGDTALMWASYHGYLEIVDLLMRDGAKE